MSKTNLCLLADSPDSASQVALWYFNQWISKRSDTPLAKVLLNVNTYICRSTAPMIILAKDEEQLLGAAQLKIREMDIYPQYQYWIGGVYVDASYRGKDIASKLVKEVIHRAKLADISHLYLQTENLNGGLYAKIGFKKIHQVNYQGFEVCVMEYDLSKISRLSVD